ncbi:MAG: hypothetical protein AB2693_01040 [Candidatus Thiodiazotropha sp.]
MRHEKHKALPVRSTIVVLFLGFLVTGCTCFSAQDLPLAYVGNIELLAFETTEEETTLEFKITGGDWETNEDRIFKDIKVSIYENNLYVTFRSCVTSGNGDAPRYTLKTTKLESGWYVLHYKNPDGSTTKLIDLLIE